MLRHLKPNVVNIRFAPAEVELIITNVERNELYFAKNADCQEWYHRIEYIASVANFQLTICRD